MSALIPVPPGLLLRGDEVTLEGLLVGAVAAALCIAVGLAIGWLLMRGK